MKVDNYKYNNKEGVQMIVYNKLIRDKIPEIINAQGKKCETRILDNEEYLNELNKKLKEELNEYYESGEIEELADITEIIYAISQHKGASIEEFEKMRQDKRDKRGGFEKRLFLLSVSKSEPNSPEDI